MIKLYEAFNGTDRDRMGLDRDYKELQEKFSEWRTPTQVLYQ